MPVGFPCSVEAVVAPLNECGALAGPWEVRRMHKGGRLAVSSYAEGVKAVGEARVLLCDGSILRI